ncbi:MAG TPA: tetratricopeptide repeat protein [Burkholderiaceae bacterium]|nr:tetratricopeptide repeat protein [Burkholderiaceae bacterium]
MTPARALLFTDVVDSTKLSHALGDADMASLWAEHDRAARDLLRTHHGREIEKTDGLLALFDAAADAVAFALAYHRALATLPVPLRARAAIHVGPIALRESSTDDIAQGAKRVEVDGLVKPITARLMATALGGQTLLSADARAALGPTALRVQSHGHWRLKGLPEPVELFEVGEPSGTRAPFTPPPDDEKAWRVVRQRDLWLPLREVRHSVPAERDSFVGRDEPLQVLARKLDAGARLVSVLGIGGTGKTRLVTRFAWTWLGDYPGGVWFCDLSQARSVDGIHFAVAQGLDVPLGKTEPVVQLAQAIAGRGKCLVILDNFEQVARHAEETLGHWLDRAPQAQFVVTTREVLGIVGEETLALAPLPPAEASRLFELRALATCHDYRPGNDDQRATEQLVRVLDGLPLAIELAAARVSVMSPQTLLARMSRRFDVLMSRAGRRDRQGTLRAAFDWSWDLLNDLERSTLAQLSVFQGGFTSSAARTVVRLEPMEWPAPEMIDLLQSLLDKSFVRGDGGTRFELLESVRDYAFEHLSADGRFPGSGAAAAGSTCRRHWAYFASLSEREATACRCIEIHNLVEACRGATSAGDASLAVRCLRNAAAALQLVGPLRAGAQLAEAVLQLPSLADVERAATLAILGSALDRLGHVEAARRHFDHGLQLSVGAKDDSLRARLLLALGVRHITDGLFSNAQTELQEAHDICERLGDIAMRGEVLNSLGRLMDHQSRFDDARARFEDALGCARQVGDRRLEGGILGNLGGLHHDVGQLARARAHYQQALDLAREVGDRRWEGDARCNLGLLLLDEAELVAAAREFEVALVIAQETGHARLSYTVLCNMGLCLMADGRAADAIGRFDAAIEAARASANRRSESQYRGYRALALARLGYLSAARASLETAESMMREVSDPLNEAVLLCHRAEIERLSDDLRASGAALDRARVIASQIEAGPNSELGRRLAALATVASP